MKRQFGNNINNNYVLCKKTCFTKTVKVFLLKLAITPIEHVCVFVCVCIYVKKYNLSQRISIYYILKKQILK
jgi:hypothetical protein